MTTSLLTAAVSDPIPGLLKKKRVLLVDTSQTKRDLRADTMRKLGIDVDCAADISEARAWWRADLYNLVLICVGNEVAHRDRFCEDIRGATPPQQLAFLVGKPEYLAGLPGVDEALISDHGDHQAHWEDVKAALSVELAEGRQRWGILEASRRISAVRSLSHARSKAIRERPSPTRDIETRFAKRSAEWSLPSAVQKEEI
jgi:CheY-like chemotaxis protein